MKTTRKENLSTSETSEKEFPQSYDRKVSRLLSEIVDLTLISEKGHGKTSLSELSFKDNR